MRVALWVTHQLIVRGLASILFMIDLLALPITDGWWEKTHDVSNSQYHLIQSAKGKFFSGESCSLNRNTADKSLVLGVKLEAQSSKLFRHQAFW
jgi:hypothetical protein